MCPGGSTPCYRGGVIFIMHCKNMCILWLIFATVVVSGCTYRASTHERCEGLALLDSINDSLYATNLSYVREATLRGMRSTNDVPLYYTFELKHAIADFYSAAPDCMTTHLANVRSYLAGQKFPSKDTLLNSLSIKSMQVQSAYFTQYCINFDSLIYYNKKALEQSLLVNDVPNIMLGYNNLADAFSERGDLVEAARYLHMGVFCVDSLKADSMWYISFYGGLSKLYTALQDFDESRTYLDRVKMLEHKMGPFDRYIYLSNLGNYYYYQEKYDSCLSTFLDAERFLRSFPDMKIEMMTCKTNVADAYLRLHCVAEAELYLDEAYNFFKSTGAAMALPYLETMRMRLAFQKHDYSTVRALEAECPSSSLKKTEYLVDRYSFLLDFYIATECWKEACEIGQQLRRLNKSSRNSRVHVLVSATKQQYKLRLASMEHKAEMQSKYKMLANAYLCIVILLLAMAFASLVAFFYIRHLRQRHKSMADRMLALRIERTRSRITPHFIYNVLNHEILRMRKGQTSILPSLVSLLRHGQDIAENVTNALRQELDFIQMYIDVESDSLGEGFTYKCTVADEVDAEKFHLPSMILHGLVENAVKHGVSPLSSTNCPKYITLQVDYENNKTVIRVANSCPNSYQPNVNDVRMHHGYRILGETLAITNEYNSCNATYGFLVTQDEDGNSMYVVTMYIPDGYKFDLPK